MDNLVFTMQPPLLCHQSTEGDGAQCDAFVLPAPLFSNYGHFFTGNTALSQFGDAKAAGANARIAVAPKGVLIIQSEFSHENYLRIIMRETKIPISPVAMNGRRPGGRFVAASITGFSDGKLPRRAPQGALRRGEFINI